MDDVSGNGSAQPVTIYTEVGNASEYASLAYEDYTNLFWGGVVNGLVIGALVALLSAVVRSLMDIARNDEMKGE